ncbi:hypothetical protein OB919_06060 [Halobacteria archaeon AArc-curdl1]|uniref:DUF8009 domain-containing protein n=1 Tax=Natronosalvus hydrolyticus TaxID=2979988 RepID=A0AAP2Z6D0_9EURY|nr:hypothetical protein [Halobacteria archaeon AArc-curdl1]
MTDEARDPRVIRSIAVTADDVLDAFVYTRENPATAVLRVTPPFHGRMRARIHVFQIDDSSVTGALHLEPARLLEDEVVAAYPSLEPGAAMDESEGTNEGATKFEHYADAVDDWRTGARSAIIDSISLDEDANDDHRVSVSVLDGPEDGQSSQ